MLGETIKKLMKARGYNQKQLSAKTGIPEATMSRYINDDREPRASALKVIADVLGVSTDALLKDYVYEEGDCEYNMDEICVNADCPIVTDYCPVSNDPGVCKWEKRKTRCTKEIPDEKRV